MQSRFVPDEEERTLARDFVEILTERAWPVAGDGEAYDVTAGGLIRLLAEYGLLARRYRPTKDAKGRKARGPKAEIRVAAAAA